MKVIYTGVQTPSTKEYKVVAEGDEVLTVEAIGEAVDDEARYGFRIEENDGKVARVECYVD
jgi:hypothetical protein